MAKRKGRPPMYDDPEKMQEAIDQYFDACDGTLLTDAEGMPMLDKYDQPIYLDRKPYTVCGLALALGFASRQSIMEYKGKAAFADTIRRALLRIEQYAEQRSYDRDGARGAEFNLRCNFGWRDKDKAEAAEAQGAGVVEIPAVLPEVQKDE